MLASHGKDVSDLSDEDVRKMVAERERRFREEAPTTAAAAATIILDGVKADRLRILVGEDAERLADLVKEQERRRQLQRMAAMGGFLPFRSDEPTAG